MQYFSQLPMVIALWTMGAFTLTAFGDAFAQWPFCPFWGTGSGMMMHDGVWGWIGGLFMLLFWVLIIVAVILFIRSAITAGKGSGPQPPAVRESSLEILKRRYAGGEIDKEQFEMMKRDILE